MDLGQASDASKDLAAIHAYARSVSGCRARYYLSRSKHAQGGACANRK